jgi:hypothetical protein
LAWSAPMYQVKLRFYVCFSFKIISKAAESENGPISE